MLKGDQPWLAYESLNSFSCLAIIGKMGLVVIMLQVNNVIPVELRLFKKSDKSARVQIDGEFEHLSKAVSITIGHIGLLQNMTVSVIRMLHRMHLNHWHNFERCRIQSCLQFYIHTIIFELNPIWSIVFGTYMESKWHWSAQALLSLSSKQW